MVMGIMTGGLQGFSKQGKTLLVLSLMNLESDNLNHLVSFMDT
jgi:hypothetical protein